MVRAVPVDICSRRCALLDLERVTVRAGRVAVPVLIGPWVESTTDRRRCVWVGSDLAGAVLDVTDYGDEDPASAGARTFNAALAVDQLLHELPGEHEAEELALEHLVVAWREDPARRPPR